VAWCPFSLFRPLGLVISYVVINTGSLFISLFIALCVKLNPGTHKGNAFNFSLKTGCDIIFPWYGVPRIVISDGGSHLIDRTFQKALSKVGVDHWIATPYHPQMSSQAETSNKQIKNILQKTVNQMGRSWRSKLSEALWAYRMTYKASIGMTPYWLVYGKTCHLLVELQHKAFWAIKKWNMDHKVAETKRKIQIAKLEEWRKKTYHSAKLYKERTKIWHDKRIKVKQFKPGDKVLLFNSNIHLFGHGKLHSKWKDPYLVLHIANHDTVTPSAMMGIRSRKMALNFLELE
jgi:hypothetical protein